VKTKFLFLVLLSCSLYSQNPENNSKFAMLFNFGSGNALVKENSSDFRIPTASYGFDVNYKTKYCYLGLGVKNNELVNLGNLTFKAIEIPVSVETTLGIGKSYNNNFSFIVGLGGFYKIPYDVEYVGSLDVKNTFGMSSKLGLQFEFSKVIFMRLYHVASYEFNKIIDDNINSAEFKKATGFGMSVGFWLW